YSFDLEYGLQRFVQARPRRVFLDLPAPAKQVYAAGFMSCAWLENEELWCWGDTSELHFRDLRGPELYWDRMKSSKGSKNYKPTFASTLPSSPLQMPDNCTPKDISVVVGAICVACDSGCAQCRGGNGDNYLGYGDSKDSWAPRNECLDF